MNCYLFIIFLIVVLLIVGTVFVFRGNTQILEFVLRRVTAYDRLMSTISDVLYITDSKLIVTRMYNTDRHSSIFELKVTDNIANIFNKYDGYAEQFAEQIRKTISGKEMVENQYVLLEGQQKHYYSVRTIRLSNGQIVVTFHNVDSEKQSETIAQQNEEILSSILDNMPVPVMVKDRDDDFRYLYWNKQCDALSGYTSEQVVGKTDIEIYGEQIGSGFRNVDLRITEPGQTYRHSETFTTPDGIVHDTIVTKNILRNELHNWLLVTRWDVTDLMEAQRALNTVNNQLNMTLVAGSITPWTWDVESGMVHIVLDEFKQKNPGFDIGNNGISIERMFMGIHPNDHQMVTTELRKLSRKEIDKAHLTIRYDLDGKFGNYYEIFSIVESFDSNGRPNRIIGSIQNITEQKDFERDLILANQKIEQVNRTNEMILNNTEIGLAYIAPDYTVLWENISKYSNHTMASHYKTGQRCYQNIQGRSEPCHMCIVEKSKKSGKREEKEALLASNLLTRIVSTPIFGDDGQYQGAVLKIKDITESRRRELDLRMAKENAEKSDRLKSAFLANMSHEIRTPLNAILGFSELLAEADDQEQKQAYLKVINSNNELLLQLINDILDLSKIEANTLEFVFSDTDLNTLMSELESSFRFKLDPEKPIEIAFEKPLDNGFIHTDRNRIQQVISNFVTNALKFTDKGSIKFGAKRRNDHIYVYVTDTGVGIPEDKLDDIFKRFTKLNNFKTGTGLGLTICQTIVHKLGGHIGVISEVGKGSTFWFTIPQSYTPGNSSPEEALLSSSTKDKELATQPDNSVIMVPHNGTKVVYNNVLPNENSTSIDKNKPILLIAEDVIDNYKLYQVLLGNKFNLRHAWNGRQAVEMFNQQRPDAILMDIKMPEMDGYQATEEIRKIDKQIAIVAVTAFAYAEDKKHIAESGFTDLITKPIHSSDLAAVLKRINILP